MIQGPLEENFLSVNPHFPSLLLSLPLTLPPDIQEFYTTTLEDNTKSTDAKAEATLKLAKRWEQQSPPIPVEAMELAKKSLELPAVGNHNLIPRPLNSTPSVFDHL